MPPVSTLPALLDAYERAGRLNLRAEDLASALPNISPAALRLALYRQQAKGRLVGLSRGSGHWLLVPLQYSVSGAPPLETWLDYYLSKTLQIPYYVGLLSAAEVYGASPYAVMVTQVIVPKPRRSITVGRHELVFHGRSNVQSMPTQWHETADGRFKVSTPELTALELVQREAQIGGIPRVQEVLRALAGSCSTQGLKQALDAAQEAPATQRLGVLLAQDGKGELAQTVQHWLQGHKTRVITLESCASIKESRLDETFKVRMPLTLETSNT